MTQFKGLPFSRQKFPEFTVRVLGRIDVTTTYERSIYIQTIYLLVSASRDHHFLACIEVVVFIQDMASFLNRVKDNIRAKYRLDVNQVVQQYDAFLQYALVTTSSFQDILDGKLNRRKRALQLTLMLYYCLYIIPRYSFVHLLHFQDDETRIYYQYIVADYSEEMGMLGRVYNVATIVFSVGLLVNYIVMRKFEGQGSLQFLTDWLKRIPKTTSIEDEDTDKITAPGDLDNESKHKLISGLHYKLIFARTLVRNASVASQSFDVIGFSLFIYKRRPSFFITLVGLYNCITVLIGCEICISHLCSLYLSYIVTTDYFNLVINNITRKVEHLKTKAMTNRSVTSILDDYDIMMSDFKKYNRVLKPLLGNLIHFYIFGLTVSFLVFAIQAEIFLYVALVVAAAGYATIMLATGVYVSQLCAKVGELHNTLVSLCAKHAGDKRQHLSLNCRFRLKHVIQELGSLETDGQFVIGLRDGEGAATSRKEVFDLTMETLSNTLMVLGFVNGMNIM